MERHNRSRKKYIASYIMFAKSLQWRDGDDLAVDVDDEHAGGGWSPPEVDSGGASPLRSSPAAAFCLSVSGFVFLRRHLLENVGGLFIVIFRSRGSFGKKDRRKRGHEGQKRWAHTAPVTGRVGYPLLPLRPPFACFFRS